jgi:hypothetical protein
LAILPFQFGPDKLRPDRPDILPQEIFGPLAAAPDSLLVGVCKDPIAIERGVTRGYIRQQFRQLSLSALRAPARGLFLLAWVSPIV